MPLASSGIVSDLNEKKKFAYNTKLMCSRHCLEQTEGTAHISYVNDILFMVTLNYNCTLASEVC